MWFISLIFPFKDYVQQIYLDSLLQGIKYTAIKSFLKQTFSVKLYDVSLCYFGTFDVTQQKWY